MTADMVEILREQGRHDIAAEIERLRARIIELEAAQKDHAAELLVVHYKADALLRQADTEIANLKATIATLRGSMAAPDPAPVGFGVTYDIPPSTPR